MFQPRGLFVLWAFCFGCAYFKEVSVDSQKTMGIKLQIIGKKNLRCKFLLSENESALSKRDVDFCNRDSYNERRDEKKSHS